MVTLGQLVKFVLDNRRGKAFKSYDEQTIANAILQCSQDGTMIYSVNNNNKIKGIVIATKDGNGTMYVHDILTIEPKVFATFVHEFQKRWPSFNLAGRRKDKEIKYKTQRLIQLSTI